MRECGADEERITITMAKTADIPLDKLALEYYTNLVRAKRRAAMRNQDDKPESPPQPTAALKKLSGFSDICKVQAQYY